MNFLSRLIMLLVISASVAATVGAAVPVIEADGYCGVIAADDDKKTDGDEKPEGDEEPDCD